MLPFCLPLLFNAKVLAKDIFLLLYFSILLCTVGQLPALALSTTVPWLAGSFMAHGLWGLKECWAA